MNVLYCSAEVAPLATTGGLSVVAAELPGALRRLGHDVRVVMPRYRALREGGSPAEGPIAAAFLPCAERAEELRVYRTALADGTPVYLLDIPAAFDRDGLYGHPDDDRRFILFARGVLALALHLRAVEGWEADIFHANDWHAALVPNYLKTYYRAAFRQAGSLYTIHNLSHQGATGPFALALAGLGEHGLVEAARVPALAGQFNFMARGIIYADAVSTVSPTYADEILTREHGAGLDRLLLSRHDRLAGILNGLNPADADPAASAHIAAHYSAEDASGKARCKADLQRRSGLAEDPARPLLGVVTRYTEQKGMDLVDQIVPWLMDATDAQLVMLGSADGRWDAAFAGHARAHPGRIAASVGFEPGLADRIFAGSDIFLMPSRFEPCGLTQLAAMRFGAVPVVRATGGLADTVAEDPRGTGFRFERHHPAELASAVARALDAFRDPDGWAELRARGMRADHSWDASAREYAELYEWVGRVARGQAAEQARR